MKTRQNVQDQDAFTPIPVPSVINGAKKANLTTVMVVGYDENGEFYAAGSHSTPTCTALVDEFTKRLRAGTWGEKPKRKAA